MAITRVHSAAIMSKVFFALLWTWFLNFLCSKGYKSVSWFLVLLPFILILFAMFFVVKEGMGDMGNKKKCKDTPFGCCADGKNAKTMKLSVC